MSRATGAIWSAIIALCMVDALWLAASGMRIGLGGVYRLLGCVSILLAVAVTYHVTGRSDRLMRVGQSAAQLVSFSAAAAVLSYLVTATNAPLTDVALARLDRTIGFDWSTWRAWLALHPTLQTVLVIAYWSLLPQIVACVVYLALTSGADEFLWAVMIAGLVTIAVSGFVPAAGNLPDAPHVPDFVALRSHTLRVIELTSVQGLIAFPSFHTALAILLTYALRGTRPVFVAACALNALLVLSVPSVGGHYIVDVLSGGAVALLAAWAARSVGVALANRRDVRGLPEARAI